MVNRFHTFRAQSDTLELRTESFLGKEYLVVPVVALVEGVLHPSNADAPELALAEEFAKVPEAWNGRPVMMNHPERDGLPTSANYPDILEASSFGFLFNTRRDGNSLKTEAWLDITRVNELGGEILDTVERLKDQEQIEVSTGLFADAVDKVGFYDNRKYSAVWTNVIPDHLAFLSKGKVGACSIEDGCGAPRQNMTIKQSGTTSQMQNAEHDCGCEDPANCECNPLQKWLIANAKKAPYGNVEYADPGYQKDGKKRYPVDTEEHIRAAWSYINMPKNAKKYSSGDLKKVKDKIIAAWKRTIDKKGPPSAKANEAFIEPAAFVNAESLLIVNSYPPDMVDRDVRTLLCAACEEQYGEFGSVYVLMFTQEEAIFQYYDMVSYQFSTWSIPYDISEIGQVTFTGEPTEVHVLTQIIPVQESTAAGSSTDDNGDEGGSMRGNSGMSTKNNETGGGGTTSSAASAESNNSAAVTTATPENKQNTTAATVAAPATPETPKVLSTQEYIDQAPEGIREVLQEGMRAQARRKSELIGQLKDSKRCEFTDEELNKMPIQMLERMAKLTASPNYSGQALPGNRQNSSGEDENAVPTPPLVFPVKAA